MRLWKSMKPRVYENPHEGGTGNPRRDHVRIPKEIVLIPEPPFTLAAHSAPLLPWEQRPSIEVRGEIGSGCSRKRKDRQRIGSADRTAPGQVWQAPGLREFRFAESQQILPLIGNRKPASDRTHWIEPAPCSSRRRSCPWGNGDTGRAVPAHPTRHGHRLPAGG